MFKTKSKTFQYSSITDKQMPFGKSSLDNTLEDFLETEQVEKPSYINAASLSGAFIMLSTIGYILFHLGLDVGPRFIYALPFLGGIFLILAAFNSHFVGEKNPKKKNKTSKEFDIFGSDEYKSYTMGQTQYDDSKPNTERGRTNTFQADSPTDSWGYYQQKNSKRLYKSRNDKKLWGVCGGLANFFGIGTIWVRTIFVVAFLMGWGSSLLIYIALGLILNKKPLDLDHPDKW